MKRTIEEHLANVRANVPGLRTEESRARIRDAKIKGTVQAYRAANKAVPDTIVVMREFVDSVMAAEDDLIRKVITIVACVDEYEAAVGRPDAPISPDKGPGVGAGTRDGVGEGGGTTAPGIVDSAPNGGPAGGAS